MLSENDYQRIFSSLKELLSSSCDYAQERLVKLLDGKTKVIYLSASWEFLLIFLFQDSSYEKLGTNDFVSLSNLLDEFIIEYDLIADKKTSTLRSWIQNQGNKFLIKFHSERKGRIRYDHPFNKFCRKIEQRRLSLNFLKL